jgi:hypothetical protein
MLKDGCVCVFGRSSGRDLDQVWAVASLLGGLNPERLESF